MRPPKIMSSHLRKTLKFNQRFCKFSNHPKPLYHTKVIKTLKEEECYNRIVIKNPRGNKTTKNLIEDIEYYTYLAEGTTSSLNHMLHKMVEMKDIPECQHLIEEFLLQYPEYLTVIYPESEDNN